ncbi:spore coat protein [Desulforamulus reducens]|uniref:spore coat protein n=1 Tax=Desulforamulus reducens TaxID=59610 RepID=UPI0002F53112|nr:spore coat protein [Desulforamulus reducens]
MPHTKGKTTARELLDLESHLMLETNMVGQFNHFAQEASNPQLQQICQNIARSRMDCFQRLVQHTNIGNIQ